MKAKTMAEANEAMGIDWMIWSELVESIPPAYTHYIGQQLSTEVIHRGYKSEDTPKIYAVA